MRVCLCESIYLSTRGLGTMRVVLTCITLSLASLPSYVDVTTPPPSSPHPPTPLWEHLTPLIPRRAHTQFTDSHPIKLPSSHMQMTIIFPPKVNCHFFKDLNLKHWCSPASIYLSAPSAALLQIKMRLDKQDKNKLALVSVTYNSFDTILLNTV